MTAIYGKSSIKEVREQKIIKRVCDKCGAKVKKGRDYIDTRSFRLCFIEQKYLAEGSRYRVGWRVNDLCNECVKLLKSWLVENDVTLEERTTADTLSLGFTCSDDMENLL